MIRKILIILLLIVSSGAYGQKQKVITAGSNSSVQDTVKKPVIQNVVSARSRFIKQDSVKKPRILREWTLSADYSEEVPIEIDTVFSMSHRVKMADKYSPFNATLGNYGLPFYQLSFFDRITDPDKYLYNYYYPLMHLPSNAVFMNTQTPYTELDWSSGGPKETSEQTFRVRHSQNVNRYLNFGLIYDIDFSLGQYNFQRAEDKLFNFYSSYTGEKYKVYFSADINNLTAFENGGIKTGSDLSGTDTRAIEVNFQANNAKSTLKNRSLLLVQRYTFGGGQVSKNDTTSHKKTGFFGLSGTFSHILTIESNRRSYKDSYPKSGFYDSIYINPKVTSDSLFSRSIKNTIRFDFTTDETRKFRLGGGVGIRNELFHYSQIIPLHVIPIIDTSEVAVWNRGNNVLIGRLYNNIGEKFRWLATGELYLTGYRIGDFNLNGEISKSFDFKKGRASWLINGSLMNRQPSFWLERWGSNNFEWNNNFKKEFRIDLGTTLRYPARKIELKFNYAIIKNYTDFDTAAFPSQYSGGLSVASILLKNELRVWKFHLATDILIQKSSNAEILDLPLGTVRAAGYFEHLFRFVKTGGKLNFQLGADVTYNTLYHPYAYMPATGRFYRQDAFTAGDYPYINVFLNLKIKRTRIFVMFDHVNANLMGLNYEMVPSYPMNIRMLRYGLSWTFYN
jgi:hypothetical protein